VSINDPIKTSYLSSTHAVNQMTIIMMGLNVYASFLTGFSLDLFEAASVRADDDFHLSK